MILPQSEEMDESVDDTFLKTLVDSVKVVIQLLQPYDDSVPLRLSSLPKLNTFFQLLTVSATELRLSNPGKP
jgi:hypothetical protein